MFKVTACLSIDSPSSEGFKLIPIPLENPATLNGEKLLDCMPKNCNYFVVEEDQQQYKLYPALEAGKKRYFPKDQTEFREVVNASLEKKLSFKKCAELFQEMKNALQGKKEDEFLILTRDGRVETPQDNSKLLFPKGKIIPFV